MCIRWKYKKKLEKADIEEILNTDNGTHLLGNSLSERKIVNMVLNTEKNDDNCIDDYIINTGEKNDHRRSGENVSPVNNWI